MKYWLMKSEPDEFSIDDLGRDKTTWWEGVRNYQARNYMLQEMRPGDLVLFYHSNADPSGVAGVAEVSAPAAPDPSAFDKKSEYFDEKSKSDQPRWFCVQVKFKKKLPRLISLNELRGEKRLKDMLLFSHSRLSVQPVTAIQFNYILQMAEKK